MKLSYYIYELRHSLPTDYENLDTRLLIRLLNSFRAIHIKNIYNQNKEIDENLAQEINFQVDIADQSTIPYINTEDRILISDREIPQVIKLSHRDLILNIRNPKILTDNYNYVSKDNAIYAGNGKFNKKDIFSFIYNDRLYIKLKRDNPKIGLITTISMRAIFENPLDCIPFQYNEYIDPMNYEYPLTDTTWGYIKSQILQNGLQIINAEQNEQRSME